MRKIQSQAEINRQSREAAALKARNDAREARAAAQAQARAEAEAAR